MMDDDTRKILIVLSICTFVAFEGLIMLFAIYFNMSEEMRTKVSPTAWYGLVKTFVLSL